MKHYVTINELIERLQVTRQAVWNWRKKGLPSIKIGRSVRFNLEDVQKWIDDQNKEGQQ